MKKKQPKFKYKATLYRYKDGSNFSEIVQKCNEVDSISLKEDCSRTAYDIFFKKRGHDRWKAWESKFDFHVNIEPLK